MVDIAGVIIHLRTQRMKMVQSLVSEKYIMLCKYFPLCNYTPVVHQSVSQWSIVSDSTTDRVLCNFTTV